MAASNSEYSDTEGFTDLRNEFLLICRSLIKTASSKDRHHLKSEKEVKELDGPVSGELVREWSLQFPAHRTITGHGEIHL